MRGDEERENAKKIFRAWAASSSQSMMRALSTGGGSQRWVCGVGSKDTCEEKSEGRWR